MTGPGVSFRNRMPACIWIFAVLWLGGLGAMTYVLVRDGPPEGYSMPAALVVCSLFWVGGAGLAAFARSKPCYAVTVKGDGRVYVTWCYPFSRVEKTFAARDVGGAVVVESTDDEGEPYFHAGFRSAGSPRIDIAEGHDRQICETACERFNAALDNYR